MEVQQSLSKKKRRWFTAVIIIIPFLILIILELLLRVVGYGHNTDLFIQYPDNSEYYVMNKFASQRFFSNSENETLGYIEPFKIVKDTNTVRIFVLGESTTEGYPYFHNGSFHRWLEYRLMHVYPNKHFEIINVSLTAVNSYTILDFGKQIAQYAPDAVLIYAGHNEYYGALGIGSTSRIANSRFLVETILTLRKSRVVQLIGNVVEKLKTKSFDSTDMRKNLMERMAAVRQIPYQSHDYDAGILQFSENMNELCRFFYKKDIPVFLSTVVSNEKDMHPLASGNEKENAKIKFQEADSAYQKMNYDWAKECYIQAKELDMLRFRAPEAMNKIIIDIAKKYRNIHLVNTLQEFRQNSLHQILGNETILEHVHPNLFGYALMSDAFYDAVQKSGIIKTEDVREMPFQELLKQMPITKTDSLYGVFTIMMLETKWPFNKPIPTSFKLGNTIEYQLAGALSVNKITWLDAMNKLFQYSMGNRDTLTACKVVEATVMEYPLNVTYKIYAGRLNYELGNYDDAVRYFKDAYALQPSFINAENLYLLLLKIDYPEEAIKYIKLAIGIKESMDKTLGMLLNVVAKIIDKKKELITANDVLSVKKQVSELYLSIGITEAALKYQ